MQFEPEESGEERRRRQRDYHAFLDAQVEARKHQPAPEDDATDRLPVLPLSARSKAQSGAPYGAGSALNFAKQNEKLSTLDDSGGLGGLDHRAEIANRNEHYSRLEQRLEAEVQRRYLVERKLGVLGQKLENWMADSATSINSLSARDAVVTEVREQTRNLDTELARMREWRNRVEATMSLAPKVQEITQQQVKALEEEARTRIQADEARSARFHQAVERVSGEVENLARRRETEDNGTLQRVAKIEVAFAGEAKGAREATKQLGAQLQALASDVSASENKMSSLLQSLRMIERRHKEQLSAAVEAKNARDETERLREQVRSLSSVVSGSESKMSSLLQAVRALETRQEKQHSVGAARPEEQVSRQQLQESLMAATSVKLDLLRTSLADEFSGLMGDTAKRAVESTNVPQLMSTLRGRVELAEERLNNMADKSFRALEDELTGVRAEVTRLEGRIDTGPIAAGLKALALNTSAAQKEAQSQLTELQDALSAEITARRRNAVRLAEAQAATKEGGRESAVQAASGLRARCLELEELVARLTRDIQTAQEDLSSQTQTQLAATQERNSRAVGKLEESLAGIRLQMAQQQGEEDRNCAKVAARFDELENLISGNKDLLREAEERARHAFTAVEAKRQEQAKKIADNLAGVESEQLVRIEAVELALREQGHSLKEAIDAGQRTSRRHSDEIRAEVESLESRLRTTIADAQEDESARVGCLIQQTQEQVNREVARVRQATDRVATETDVLRERINSEEASRMESAQDLHHDLSKSTEALQSRFRLWADDRFRKERAAMEESLERAEAQGGMVRTLLDEAVKAVSKELEILRSESRERNMALEESFDERASDLETRVTEIDNVSAKKRRVSELTIETGARIGEVERRVRQAEKELKEELEVKLAVSSLVSSVADNAFTHKLKHGSSEIIRLEEKRRMAEAVESKGGWRVELEKTNVVVAGLQAELNTSRGWQASVDDLDLKLTSRIEELKTMVEAAESTAAMAKESVPATLEAEANESNGELKEGVSAIGTTRVKEAAAANPASGAKGQLAKNGKNKAMDFAALNDQLEADEEEADGDSPPSSRLSADSNAIADDSNLKTRVSEIEDELARLKQRLDEGVAAMESLTQELLGAGSAAGGLPKPQRAPSLSQPENGVEKADARAAEEPAPQVSDDSVRSGNKVDTPPLSPKSGTSYTPPLSPKSDIMSETDTSDQKDEREAVAPETEKKSEDGRSETKRSELKGADITSNGSDTESQGGTSTMSDANNSAQSERGTEGPARQSEGEDEESETDGSEPSSDGEGESDGSQAEEDRSRRPSSADEVELASRRGEQDPETASDARSASGSEETRSESDRGESEDEGRSDQEVALESRSGSERSHSVRSDEDDDSNRSGSEGSDGSETEGSVVSRSERSASREEEGDEESSDDGLHSSGPSQSEASPRRSPRGSSSEETDK